MVDGKWPWYKHNNTLRCHNMENDKFGGGNATLLVVAVFFPSALSVNYIYQDTKISSITYINVYGFVQFSI